MKIDLRLLVSAVAVVLIAAKPPSESSPKLKAFTGHLRTFAKASQESTKQDRALSELLTLASSAPAIEFLYERSSRKKLQEHLETGAGRLRKLLTKETDPQRIASVSNLLGVLHRIGADCGLEGADVSSLECSENAFRRSVETAGRFLPMASLNLADVLLSRKKYEEAQRVLQQLDPADFGDHEPHVRGALCWASTNPVDVRRYPIDAVPARSVGRAPDFTRATRSDRVSSVVVLSVLINDRGEVMCVRPLKGLSHGLTSAGTWCKPCKSAIPHLRRLNRQASKAPFTIVGVASDCDEDMLRDFVAERDMTWPQYLDDCDHSVTRETFGVRRYPTYPTYLLVNHEGVVVYRRSGWSNAIAAEVSAQVKKAIWVAEEAVSEEATVGKAASAPGRGQEVII